EPPSGPRRGRIRSPARARTALPASWPSRKSRGRRMNETLREFLDRLRAEGELVDIRQPVDIVHIATLVDQAEQALCFHQVIGYDIPVVSGLIRSQRRAALAMGCDAFREIEARLQHGIAHPIAP